MREHNVTVSEERVADLLITELAELAERRSME
jgi:hypothetical protein